MSSFAERSLAEHYRGKRIVITGASSGIGKDLALLFSAWGAHLALTARRRELLDEVKVEAETAEGCGEVLVTAADVRDSAAMQAMADDVLARWGHVDLVIGNAGIGGLNPATCFDLEIHRRTLEINCLGLANTLVPYIPSMLARREGHLVGVSSLAAFRGRPRAASYSSAKAQQGVFLESLRMDLRPHGIAVSAIHPGFVVTPMTEHTDFNMPFMVDVRKSSLLIARALKRRAPRYLYPWQMRWLVRAEGLLPCRVYDWLLPRVSGQREDLKPRTL
ncbi:SDR family NAD(P)-dependent oxidoreductase [Myxococcota bacterium]|nr:SDR family NAD(P)-dependent oxidoreductase [Myxococcota bacterium]